MPNRINFAPGEYYHVYNRGTEKRKTFMDRKDYERFMALLYLSNNNMPMHISNHQGSTLPMLLELPRNDTLVDICAYTLMPNHFHLLLHGNIEGGISRFMQKMTTGYTMYFNKKYERSGALFQGKFKATHATTDEYLKYLISYIHLNPIKLIDPLWKDNGITNKKKAKGFLNAYSYSSYQDYRGIKRIEKNIINATALPDYFHKPLSFEKNIEDWLSYKQM